MAPFALRRAIAAALLARWRWVLAYSLVEIGVPWLLLATPSERLSSSIAGLLVAAVPLMGALLYRLAGTSEHFTGRRLAGLVLGFVGVAALVGLRQPAAVSHAP